MRATPWPSSRLDGKERLEAVHLELPIRGQAGTLPLEMAQSGLCVGDLIVGQEVLNTPDLGGERVAPHRIHDPSRPARALGPRLGGALATEQGNDQ